MGKLSIFGGTGFVGSNFVKLHPDKCNVIQRDNNVPIDHDVLYLISTTHNYHVFSDVHLDVNTNLTKLLNVLPNTKGTFNFVSSWFSYGDGYGTNSTPAFEHSDCRPKGFYSITKKAAEDLMVSYCKTFNKEYRILRLCNVIGGDVAAGKKKNALEFLIHKIVKSEPIDIYRGDNYRNFLHVEDVCEAINLITSKGNINEIYNIGTQNSHKLIDVVNHVMKLTKSNSKINYVDVPTFHSIVQAPNFFMNCQKLYDLGFQPKYDVYKAVEHIVAKNLL
jgi:nucleoside-diphosphate-sugar epimerase